LTEVCNTKSFNYENGSVIGFVFGYERLGGRGLGLMASLARPL
jgi:hypothetical protein